MNTVRGRRGGVEQQVGVSSVEVAVQGLGNRLQVQVLDTPHLQARLLPRVHKLFMGNHGGSAEDKQEARERFAYSHCSHLLRQCSRSSVNK